MLNNNNYVYITYLSNDRDYKGVLLLNYNLKKYNSKYQLECIVLEGVSNKIKNILTKTKIKIHEFILLNILKEFNIDDEYGNYLLNKHYYGKFLIFKLTNYDKIVYLDTDLLIRENIDNLFDYDTVDKIYMTYDLLLRNNNNLIFKKNEFNSGVIVLQPSLSIFKNCYNSLLNYKENIVNLSTDQTIFNLLNKNKIMNIIYLDFKYNFIGMLGNNENIIKDKPIIIHFIMYPKPWNIIDFDENIIEYKMYSDAKKYFLEWIELYFDMIKEKINYITNYNVFFNINNFYLEDNSNIIKIDNI